MWVQGSGRGAADGAGAVAATAAQRGLGGAVDVAAGGGGGPGRVPGYALQLLPGSLSLIQSSNLCNATVSCGCPIACLRLLIVVCVACLDLW
jgi:hypothetical protein